ncbi:MAG: hypothetical protein ACI9EF_003668, partial [Pseudohongiellaceae bacterium]
MTRDGQSGELSATQLQRVRSWSWYFHHGSHMEEVHDGAVLRDDFSDPGLDKDAADSGFGFSAEHSARSPWKLWQSDSDVKVQLEDGMLSIRGRSSLAG